MIREEDFTELRIDMRYARERIDHISTQIDAVSSTLSDHTTQIIEIKHQQDRQKDAINDITTSSDRAWTRAWNRLKTVLVIPGVIAIILEVSKHINALDRLVP